jgi:mono/diheme cytochrome c family protein
MTRSRRRDRMFTMLAVVGLMVTASCRRAPAPSPRDPMIEAIRAEEREGGAFTYAESQGKRLFTRYCATCHGDEGRGDGQNASNLNPVPPDMTLSREATDAALMRRVIAEGSAAVGRSPLSPPWARSLSRQEIDDLVSYCRSLARKNKPGRQ